MFEHLQIYDRRERWAVGLADLAFRMLAAPASLRRASHAAAAPRRVLVLRLERIGDLLMTFDALALLRASLPDAEIDLCVGTWNEPLAQAMAVAGRIDCLDAPWLARDEPGSTWASLLAHARGWRAHGYDLAINLEPDIRSNLLLRLSGATCRVGYYTGGGGALLTDAVAYDPTLHIYENALRLVGLAVPGAAGAPVSPPRLQVPDGARERARSLLAPAAGSLCVAVHAGGGRPVKQWHTSRFADVATALGREYGATIVLTGTSHEAGVIDEVQAAIPGTVRVLNLSGQADLLDMAAVLERVAVFITGDTGPMHLAAAVGTPLVSIFGPSDPVRYAPRTERSRIVRIDLPCAPCNRIRLPPERCRGHVPDCLDGITVDRVLAAVRECLSLDSATAFRTGSSRP
jgi:lipopolysaccharide heptosyltransferase II